MGSANSDPDSSVGNHGAVHGLGVRCTVEPAKVQEAGCGGRVGDVGSSNQAPTL